MASEELVGSRVAIYAFSSEDSANRVLRIGI